jgi:hypothetical protein
VIEFLSKINSRSDCSSDWPLKVRFDIPPYTRTFCRIIRVKFYSGDNTAEIHVIPEVYPWKVAELSVDYSAERYAFTQYNLQIVRTFHR